MWATRDFRSPAFTSRGEVIGEEFRVFLPSQVFVEGLGPGVVDRGFQLQPVGAMRLRILPGRVHQCPCNSAAPGTGFDKQVVEIDQRLQFHRAERKVQLRESNEPP